MTTSLDQLRQRFQSTNDKPAVENDQPGKPDFDQRLDDMRDALKGVSEGAPAVHTGDDTRSEPSTPVKDIRPKPKLPPKPAKAPRAPGRAPLPHGPKLDEVDTLKTPEGYTLEGQKALHLRDQRSDKVYIVEVLRQKDTEQYVVRVRYGRRGRELRRMDRAVYASAAKAKRDMNDLIASKVAKGYRYGLNP